MFGEWITRGLSCWSKIPHGSPTMSEIKVNFYQDLVAGTHTDFFQGQMDRGLFYWPNLSGITQLTN
jgi:hypothetical protein